MPLSERQIETTGDFLKSRAIVLEFLTSKGYKVQQDLNTRIIAKHPFSATAYPHGVEVDLDFSQAGNSKIIMRIDHAGSAVYIDRLAKELTLVLPQNKNNLGLLEGEEIKLQYVCYRQTISPPSLWDGKSRIQTNKGLLVFTNDNMIFMQQEGGSSYGQTLRFPLESISGLVSGGTIIKHIRFMIGVSGSSDQHEFVNFQSVLARQQEIQDVRADIDKLLKVAREEKKRLAIEAMTKGTVPTMVFCKFCGARNKADKSNCANCGAALT